MLPLIHGRHTDAETSIRHRRLSHREKLGCPCSAKRIGFLNIFTLEQKITVLFVIAVPLSSARREMALWRWKGRTDIIFWLLYDRPELFQHGGLNGWEAIWCHWLTILQRNFKEIHCILKFKTKMRSYIFFFYIVRLSWCRSTLKIGTNISLICTPAEELEFHLTFKIGFH